MENEKNDIALINKDNNYNSISNELYFKLEFHDQKINDKTSEFLKWKKTMIKIYGENAKLFKCIKDDIFFYSTDKDCKSYPFYRHKCPICKVQICLYCSQIIFCRFTSLRNVLLILVLPENIRSRILRIQYL